MGEVWLPVPGWEGRYEVSDHGRVRSLYFRSMRRLVPKTLKGIPTKEGYLRVCLRNFPREQCLFIHRIVLQAFTCCSPEGYEAVHLNGDNRDNRLGNLTWATRTENERMKVGHGTSTRGERNGCSRLTEKAVLSMRRRFAAGETQKSLAADYGVVKATVWKIVRRKAWAHVA